MIALALRYWWAIAIAALLALVGVQQVRVDRAQKALSEYKLEVAENARIAEQLARKESERMQRAYDEEAAAAREERAALESDVSRLADTADGMRDELASFRQRAKQDSCIAIRGKGKPSTDPLDLLAELYARADKEAAELASYADRLRQAGIACERAADKIVG